jgi:hypothetical protein
MSPSEWTTLAAAAAGLLLAVGAHIRQSVAPAQHACTQDRRISRLEERADDVDKRDRDASEHDREREREAAEVNRKRDVENAQWRGEMLVAVEQLRKR